MQRENEPEEPPVPPETLGRAERHRTIIVIVMAVFVLLPLFILVWLKTRGGG